jgi:hypothetical protein
MRSLLIGSFFSLLVITSPEAQEKPVRPDESACPVRANLFPEQIRRTDFIRFIFREGNAFPRRISLALIHPQKEGMFIEYRWTGDRKVRSGTLAANGEGRIDCFFLGIEAIAEDDFCKEFILFIPEEIIVNEIAFSSREVEQPQILCPMPGLAEDIEKAFSDCVLYPRDESKTLRLIQLLEKTTPKYGCRRAFDSRPVPAWWLAGSDAQWRWIGYLYDSILENNSEALRVFTKFLTTSDGAFAEVISEQLWGILWDRPLLILENWTGIEPNKEWVLMCRPSPYLGGRDEVGNVIAILKDMSNKEPKYKSACEEIISILSEKSNAD